MFSPPGRDRSQVWCTSLCSFLGRGGRCGQSVKFRVRCLRQASRCDRRGFHIFGCVKVGPSPQKIDWNCWFLWKKARDISSLIHFDRYLPNEVMILPNDFFCGRLIRWPPNVKIQSVVLGWCIIYRSWKCMVCLCEFKKHMWCWRCQECQETMEDPRRSFSLGHLYFTRHIAHHQRKKHQLHIFADTGYISGNCAREWVWLDVSSKTLTLRTSGYPQGLRLKNGNDSFYIMWIKKDIPVCVCVGPLISFVSMSSRRVSVVLIL